MWVEQNDKLLLKGSIAWIPQEANYVKRVFWLALAKSFEKTLVKKFWLLLHIWLDIVDKWLC